jgi:hypothetical protein
MYQDLLGRTPNDDEVREWVDYLNSGASTQDVAYGFAASREREGIRIQADYQTYLGRDAAQQEVDLWVGAFADSGWTNEDVVAGFAGSAEYFQNHGSSINNWLGSMYQDVLHRDAGDAEIATWDAYLL